MGAVIYSQSFGPCALSCLPVTKDMYTYDEVKGNFTLQTSHFLWISDAVSTSQKSLLLHLATIMPVSKICVHQNKGWKSCEQVLRTSLASVHWGRTSSRKSLVASYPLSEHKWTGTCGWATYVPENSTSHEDLYFAPCTIPVCNAGVTLLPNSSERLGKEICLAKRRGLMCGQCENNHSVFYHPQTLFVVPTNTVFCSPWLCSSLS